MTSPVAYWHVPDIEAKLAEVTAGGATVKEPVRDVGGGRLVATVTDECRPLAPRPGVVATPSIGSPRSRPSSSAKPPRRRPPSIRFVHIRPRREETCR